MHPDIALGGAGFEDLASQELQTKKNILPIADNVYFKKMISLI